MSMLLRLQCLFSLTTLCVSVKVDFTAEYFSNVTLVCDERTARNAYPAFLKYWVLPDQSTIQWNQQPDGKHSLSPRPEYSLNINRLQDDDFGTYHCVILWDNRFFIVDTIRVHLSADYGNIQERIKKRAMIGGIATGATACLCFLICLLCYLKPSQNREDMKREEERQVVYELDRTVERFDEALSGNDEVALAQSEITPSSRGRVRDSHVVLDPGYATVDKVRKIATIETNSEGSSGFFDNKLFDIENEGLYPYDESTSEMNFSREFGDTFF